jgi:3-hydroxybutyryl-CoA dehydrogenase
MTTMAEPLFPGTLVSVVGAGTMGSGIAHVAARAGHPVVLFDAQPDALERARRGIAKDLAFLVSKQRIEAAEADAILGRITTAPDLEATARSALVIEAIAEDRAAKRSLFAALEALVADDCILATNTSSFPIGDIAKAVPEADRARVAGLHYFMPAHLVPLVEIVRSEFTADWVVDRLEGWMRDARKAPIRVNKDICGFIGNRLQAALIREALYLVESGVTTAQGIDDAVRFGFGFRFLACGPMKQKEFSGWDTNLAAGNVIYPTLCNNAKHGAMLHGMVAAGHIGMKTKQGFWEYTDEKIAAEKAAYEKKLRQAFELLQSELGG